MSRKKKQNKDNSPKIELGDGRNFDGSLMFRAKSWSPQLGDRNNSRKNRRDAKKRLKDDGDL